MFTFHFRIFIGSENKNNGRYTDLVTPIQFSSCNVNETLGGRSLC